MLTIRERAVKIMEHLVTHNSHGYSQANRFGNGEWETVTLSDGTEVTLQCGDRDCSSGVIEAWEKAYPGCTGGANTTYDIKNCFENTGLWEWCPVGGGDVPHSGDVMLKNGHVGMFLEPSRLMHFSLPDEAELMGDQTGVESFIMPFSWPEPEYLGFLTYTGPDYSSSRIAAMQQTLNERLAAQGQPGVTVNGFYDHETQKGLVRLIQVGLVIYQGAPEGNIDGWYGDQTFYYVNLLPVARWELDGGAFMFHGELAWAAKAMLVGAFGADLDLSNHNFDTAAAGVLNAFKADNGLYVNGICDARTFALLAPLANVSTSTGQYYHAAGDPVPPVYPEPEDFENPNPDEGEGSGSGETGDAVPSAAVAAMQTLLNGWLEARGLDPIEENGVYMGNAQTQGALVRLLQKSRNDVLSADLAVNGVVDAGTSSSMDECPAGSIGATDWVVKAMLVGCGLDGIDLSSAFYDEAARQALMAFQNAAGLPTNGLCNGAVLAALAPAAVGESTPDQPEQPDLPEQVEFIEVDGWWDQDTTAALQRHYGTVADGEVWGQWQPNLNANTALRHGWIADAYGSGSAVIRKLQEDLGTAVDGVFGGADIFAIQARCGQIQTGALIGPDPTVMELQRRLNYGLW